MWGTRWHHIATDTNGCLFGGYRGDDDVGWMILLGFFGFARTTQWQGALRSSVGVPHETFTVFTCRKRALYMHFKRETLMVGVDWSKAFSGNGWITSIFLGPIQLAWGFKTHGPDQVILFPVQKWLGR